MQVGPPKKLFRAGDLAPVTGIYLVQHHPRHRPPHEAIVIRGEQLPPCRTCKSEVLYEVRRQLSHITHDWDFSGLVGDPKPRDFAALRRFPRFRIELPIVVRVGRTGRAASLAGTTNNLSERGTGAIIEGKLSSSHKTAWIEIGLGRNEAPVRLHARLRYRKGVQHGFEFTRITEIEREAIRTLISKQRPQPARM